MPVLPVPHFEWQVLRAAKRSKRPPTGRQLRLIPSRRTKDGAFLTALVQHDLLTYDSGNAADPFDATYRLTVRGEHAAEYGECEMTASLSVLAKPSKPTAKTTTKTKPKSRRAS
ncbi:hypothetical protein [Frigoriglobus tundricola]|uniref:Uncharacterized protein n=1 Tax=Frigoriglobus tundricola TaxID=2774151 RepID=A0A6M5Z5H0_9BACT|nr:hypothetical protein [Frigoriglobus tundricola]QJX01336.1 hypothetical protein FTUN_8980 [Frigoriglobus tundricola]